MSALRRSGFPHSHSHSHVTHTPLKATSSFRSFARPHLERPHGFQTIAIMINLQSIVLLFVSYFVIPRLTFLPKSLHSLLIIFGPFLLPKVLNLFNTQRATSRSVPVRPTPPKVQRALNLLFVSTLAWLILTLPRFAPENIFLKAQSRWQIAPDVLFTRLRLLRPLMEVDEVLREKFNGSVTNKLIYLTYGPDTLINCIWCASSAGNDALNYFLYSVPKIATPHIFHFAVLGLTTSSMVGTEGSRFRMHATIVGLALLAVELWFLGTYDLSTHKKAKQLHDIDFVYWRVRFLRYVSFAAADAGLGFVLWLTSTNRWLATPPSIAERLEATTGQAEENQHKLRALGLLTNSINRDAALRGFREEYWRTEAQVMAETVQEEDVMAQINNALGKMDMRGLEGRVSEVADGILSGIDGLRASQILSESGNLQAPQ